MPKEFLLPELAESVVEGEIMTWLVSEGSVVEEDQPLLEVMTDKATVEIPSPFKGILVKQLVAEGDIVEIHKPIALFDDADGVSNASPNSLEHSDVQASSSHAPSNLSVPPHASLQNLQNSQQEQPQPVLAQTVSSSSESTAYEASPSYNAEASVSSQHSGVANTHLEPATEVANEGTVFFEPSAGADETPMQIQRKRAKKVLAAPAARKLARDKKLNLEEVPGSGPNGRIRVEDVRKHIAQRNQTLQVPSTPRRVSAAYQALEERTPMRGLRRTIAKQMVASHLQTVRTLLVDEADVSGLVALRNRLKPKAEDRGVKLSYLPFIMKAVVSALRAYPMMNASLDVERDEIVMRRYYNFGLAVATDTGLLIPVIKDIDKKGLLQLGQELIEIAARARAGRLTPDDVRDGTFSITNIGSYSGLFSFPIINVNEAAILGVHRIKKRPVVLEDDSIVARPMMYLSTSFDHRIVDGAEAAMFTSHLIEILETPESLLLEV
ncbi:MAG: dihydrolipoamide acetyltransferase family protein [Deinococcota bacterium]